MEGQLHDDGIPLAAAQLRPDGQVPVLSNSFEDLRCQIFKVDFEDESWVIRVPNIFEDSLELRIHLLEAEVSTLTELEEQGFRWAPKLKGYDLTFDNPIGRPFIAVTWLQGNQLAWSDDSPARPIRDKILQQLAKIQAALIECSQEKRATTATEHYATVIQNKIIRIRDGTLPELTEQDVSDQLSLLPTVLVPEVDDTSWAIDHGELVAENILIDAEHNITGITTWDLASKEPLQQAASFPAILLYQDLAVPPSSTIKKDQETYIASISQNSPAGESMAIVQSSEEADFRVAFLESITSKGTHREMARSGWRKAPAFQK
ncbi:hypothetical protein N7490_001578 [Penicillium lividum]|nr:hypothetical protein N7490_001578 [Penicillium lividum]